MARRADANRVGQTDLVGVATQDDPERGDGRHRGRTGVLVAGGVVGLVGLALLGYGWAAWRLDWFPFHGARPRAVTLDEARRRFLEERVGGGSVARPLTPAEGVYRYEGTGSESLSNPPRTQAEGPELPGTVTHGVDGCWDFRLDYSTNHWRRWTYCVTGGRLVQQGSEVYQRWDFGTFAVDNTTTMTCRPPPVIMEAGMAVGDRWRAECRGESTQISGTTISAGTHRLVGIESLTVGGRPVEAFHFRDRRTVSGAQSGTERFDSWLSPEGLVLRGRQRIAVDSDSPLGRVTYTQQSEFALASLDPAR